MGAIRPPLDFTQADILIKPISNEWGPFNFDMSAGIASGDSIISGEVESFVKDTGVESTSELIEPDSISVVTGNTIQVQFQYPTNGDFIDVRHYLKFKLTFTGGTKKHSYIFGHVAVQNY